MNLFPWRKKTDVFTQEEKQQMLEAVQLAERHTSGEIRVFIESRCRFMDALDRAREVFLKLKMTETSARNATLIYVAVKDRQTAVFGDEGIHGKVGEPYWAATVQKMLLHFKDERLADGICHAINDLGNALNAYFPYDPETDKNELPDEIIFGR